MGLVVVILLVLEVITNRVEQMTGHVWDFVYYIDIAKNGVIGNDHLAAPYAYRALTPLMARWINQALGTELSVGFRVLAYIGCFSTLYGVYLLGRKLTSSYGRALILVLLPALSLFNIKFLLFDSYRPDLLAYPLLIWGMLALMEGRYGWVVLASLVGIQMREFPIIPTLIYLWEMVKVWWGARKNWVPLLKIGVVLGLVGVAIALPRLLIPVKFTQQILDPQNDPNFLNVLFGMPLDLKRDINYLSNLLSYFLPVLILATGPRLKQMWLRLGKYRSWLVIYLGVVLFGMTYGGTDMMRYVTYLFIPLVFLVAPFLEMELHWSELVYMLAAMAVFNHIFELFPVNDYSAYVDFYGGYGSILTAGSFMRFTELFGFIFGGMLLRLVLKLFKTNYV